MSELYNYENEPSGGAPDPEKYDDFYLRLRARVDEYIENNPGGELLTYLTYIPDFFYMLVKLATDPEVPKANKTQIVAALAYFISPLDVVPDFLGGLGWLDDLYVALIVVDNLLNAVDASVVEKYWPGDKDIVGVIKTTMDNLNEKLGAGAIRRLIEKFKS